MKRHMSCDRICIWPSLYCGYLCDLVDPGLQAVGKEWQMSSYCHALNTCMLAEQTMGNKVCMSVSHSRPWNNCSLTNRRIVAAQQLGIATKHVLCRSPTTRFFAVNIFVLSLPDMWHVQLDIFELDQTWVCNCATILVILTRMWCFDMLS